MTGKPDDEDGGLTPAEEIMLEMWLRAAAMSPEQLRRTLAMLERIDASELN